MIISGKQGFFGRMRGWLLLFFLLTLLQFLIYKEYVLLSFFQQKIPFQLFSVFKNPFQLFSLCPPYHLYTIKPHQNPTYAETKILSNMHYYKVNESLREPMELATSSPGAGAGSERTWFG